MRNLMILLLSILIFFPSVNALYSFNPSEIISYYNFSESSGNLTDYYHNNDFIVNNASRRVLGSQGKAYYFDGDDDYAYFNQSLIGYQNFSISAWYYVNGTVGDTALVSGRASVSGNPIIMLGTFPSGGGGVVYFRLRANNGSGITNLNTSTSANSWNHVIATFDVSTGNQTIYLNGNYAGSLIYTGGSFSNIDVFSIASIYRVESASAFFNGSIDEVGLFNHTLNSTEVSELWNGGLGSFPNSETNTPNVTIIQPSGAKTSQIVNYNVSFQEDSSDATCTYRVTFTNGNPVISNTTVSCTSYITGSFDTSTDGSFLFHFWGIDAWSNTNYSSSSFSVDTSTGGGGGGGGGSTTIISGDKGWSMEASAGIGRIEANMVSGTSRTFSINFENLGDSSRTIKLSCTSDSAICEYVSFPDNPFKLALISGAKQSVDFIVELPEDFSNGDYSFNIVATDDLNRNGVITVILNVGTAGFITNLLTKIFSTASFGVPYALIFFPILIFGFIIFTRLYQKVALRPFWVILSSFSISFIVLYFI